MCAEASLLAKAVSDGMMKMMEGLQAINFDMKMNLGIQVSIFKSRCIKEEFFIYSSFYC